MNSISGSGDSTPIDILLLTTINITTIMDISFNEDFIQLIGFDRYNALKSGTAQLYIGLKDMVLYEDNMSKISVIKNGTIKRVE